jgi:hypothetical protein
MVSYFLEIITIRYQLFIYRHIDYVFGMCTNRYVLRVSLCECLCK